ncbi:MAG TPA: site-specific integrase, partial [Gillisia sp.]|nr:site-specific integrase [Gillisia sp.]
MSDKLYPLFFIRRNLKNAEEATIYLRITFEGKRAETSARQKVPIKLWNPTAGRAIGNSTKAQRINKYLNKVEINLYQCYQTLMDLNQPFTAKSILVLYLGKKEKHKMLLEIFQEHNDKVNRLIGQDFAAGTAERYRTAKMHIENYIKKEYKIKDIPVKDVDHKFISGLEYYLKTERKCSHNSALKYITNFKKIIRIAFANEWIKRDPFLHWKGTLKIVDREFLSQEEIQLMLEKEINNDRLDLVRDIFIFCCYTGLAYADVKKLSENDV